jgi:hypothetical protein
VNRVTDKLFEIISWAWLFRLVYGFGDAIAPSGVPRVHLIYGGGRCRCLFGPLPEWCRREVAEVLAEAGVHKAVVKQMKDGRFKFSRSVPEPVRQRIRNIMVSR